MMWRVQAATRNQRVCPSAGTALRRRALLMVAGEGQARWCRIALLTFAHAFLHLGIRCLSSPLLLLQGTNQTQLQQHTENVKPWSRTDHHDQLLGANQRSSSPTRHARPHVHFAGALGRAHAPRTTCSPDAARSTHTHGAQLVASAFGDLPTCVRRA